MFLVYRCVGGKPFGVGSLCRGFGMATFPMNAIDDQTVLYTRDSHVVFSVSDDSKTHKYESVIYRLGCSFFTCLKFGAVYFVKRETCLLGKSLVGRSFSHYH